NFPGIVHSALLVNGTRCICGRRQLVKPRPANAIDALISFMKSRRDHSSSLISEAPAGNSRSSHSRNCAVLLYSPRLRQYFFPVSGSSGCWKTRFINNSEDRHLACLGGHASSMSVNGDGKLEARRPSQAGSLISNGGSGIASVRSSVAPLTI